MDWRGVVPLVVAVGALLLAFDEAAALSDASWGLVAGYALLAVIAAVVFWRLQAAPRSRSSHPRTCADARPGPRSVPRC